MNEKTFIICKTFIIFLYILFKDSNFQTNLKHKVLKNVKQNIIQAVCPTLHWKYYVDACVPLNARTVPAAFALIEFRTYSILLASFLQQTSEDCIGNTEHSDVMWKLSAIVNHFCTLANPNGVRVQ